jgi:cytochrome bd-type quinol oxidase subunit 1
MKLGLAVAGVAVIAAGAAWSAFNRRQRRAVNSGRKFGLLFGALALGFLLLLAATVKPH